MAFDIGSLAIAHDNNVFPVIVAAAVAAAATAVAAATAAAAAAAAVAAAAAAAAAVVVGRCTMVCCQSFITCPLNFLSQYILL